MKSKIKTLLEENSKDYLFHLSTKLYLKMKKIFHKYKNSKFEYIIVNLNLQKTPQKDFGNILTSARGPPEREAKLHERPFLYSHSLANSPTYISVLVTFLHCNFFFQVIHKHIASVLAFQQVSAPPEGLVNTQIPEFLIQ